MFNEKKEILEGYKQFKKLMEENNIWYSAYAGTAIGATRDGGMIPWDDDIDTLITYDGFKKLVEICPNNILKSRDDDYPLMFPKWVPDRSKALESSVFVDLFVVVKTTMKKVKKYRSLKNKIKFGLYATAHKNHKPFSKGVKVLSVIAKMLKPFFRKQLDFDKVISDLYDENGEIHISIVNPVEPFSYVLIEDFTTEVQNYKFEDTTVPLFKTYEDYLLKRYGNIDAPDMANKIVMEHLDAMNIHFIKYKDINKQ